MSVSNVLGQYSLLSGSTEEMFCKKLVQLECWEKSEKMSKIKWKWTKVVFLKYSEQKKMEK